MSTKRFHQPSIEYERIYYELLRKYYKLRSNSELQMKSARYLDPDIHKYEQLENITPLRESRHTKSITKSSLKENQTKWKQQRKKRNVSLLLTIFILELTGLGVRTKFKKTSFDTESGKLFLPKLRHCSFIHQRRGFAGLINF